MKRMAIKTALAAALLIGLVIGPSIGEDVEQAIKLGSIGETTCYGDTQLNSGDSTHTSYIVGPMIDEIWVCGYLYVPEYGSWYTGGWKRASPGFYRVGYRIGSSMPSGDYACTHHYFYEPGYPPVDKWTDRLGNVLSAEAAKNIAAEVASAEEIST